MTWNRSFLKRRPELNTILATTIPRERHINATSGNIRRWFADTIVPLNEQHAYDPHMIANCDETMVQFGAQKRLKIIAPRRNAYKRVLAQSQIRHITFVVTIFANGTRTQTLIIYPTKTLPQEITLEQVAWDPDFSMTGNPAGWIDKATFSKYCRTIVIPAFQRQRECIGNPTARGLFLVDGHSSRWNADLMVEFSAAGIDVVTLVSHTSHVSQPLDAIVFGVFKDNLSRCLRRALTEVRRSPPTASQLRRFDLEDSIPDDAVPPRAMDMDDDEELFATPVMSENEVDGDEEDTPNGDFPLPVRRYILVEVAKMCLHGAFYRNHIQQSYRITGTYPISVDLYHKTVTKQFWQRRCHSYREFFCIR